jgi:hydroxyacylglutathione hydrolase
MTNKRLYGTLHAMRIVIIPCLKDNFAYLVCANNGEAAVVDPGESAPVVAAAQQAGVGITTVWATHHHPDHVGGINDLMSALGPLNVVAHRSDAKRIPQATTLVDDGDIVTIGNIRATIVFNPGHTLGAISYWLADNDAVFTGDTLFGAGCGRMFEGTPAMMHSSLMRLAALPPATKVYFGHEYTASNLRFAEAVSPGEAATASRSTEVANMLGQKQPSSPSTIGAERDTNPFLRCDHPAIVAAAAARTPGTAAGAATFAVLREWKNQF